MTQSLRQWTRRARAVAFSFALAWLGLEEAQASSPAPSPVTQSPQTSTLDLNRATAAELAELPGIGPKRAERIIAERRRRPFRSVNDLARISGIGKKTVAKIRPHLHVGTASGAVSVKAAKP